MPTSRGTTKPGGSVPGAVFNIFCALVLACSLAYGLATQQDLLIVLGAFGLGGWAARARWGGPLS
jgi:hypothetical protein